MNDEFKKQMDWRLRGIKSDAVKKYVVSIKHKIDAAGPAAGIWLEQLESRWEQFEKSPQGLTKDFSPEDFSDLKYVLFGTRK